ncbi:hypothetical protein Pa4123_22270 [Phytohabitans aurantiacus]|uniref:Uncharacterized protein n=1 Tax=Phytohabitans aurantiacus TaxID=3016789 RepID=A0ABQ5QQP1_9ACTN|nr:hypothetical protein Pa4123_22270 [Phytohabitans aurantiacus]
MKPQSSAPLVTLAGAAEAGATTAIEAAAPRATAAAQRSGCREMPPALRLSILFWSFLDVDMRKPG